MLVKKGCATAAASDLVSMVKSLSETSSLGIPSDQPAVAGQPVAIPDSNCENGSSHQAKAMNPTAMKAVVALLPVSILFSGALLTFARRIAPFSLLLLLGAGCLLMVALAHLCEGLHWFPWMQWGMEHSAGHYLDLTSAVLGLTLFPVGYLLHAIAERHA